MKSLIEIGVVALVVGGISAAGSFYWQQQLRKAAAADPASASTTETKPAEQKAEPTNSAEGVGFESDEPVTSRRAETAEWQFV